MNPNLLNIKELYHLIAVTSYDLDQLTEDYAVGNIDMTKEQFEERKEFLSSLLNKLE